MPTPPTVGHMASEPPPIPSDERLNVIRAGHSGDADLARRCCSSEDPSVREAAYGALARLKQLDDETLVAALGDPTVRVCRRATELSSNAEPSTQVDQELLRLLSGDEYTLAESAAWALGERHQSKEDDVDDVDDVDERTVDPTILSALASAATGHADALVREAATAALGCIGAPSTLWAVVAACRDKATVRRRAVIALAAFDGPEVDAALLAAREDRDWQVRQAAEDLLQQ
jgi:HEAT repeat protein